MATVRKSSTSKPETKNITIDWNIEDFEAAISVGNNSLKSTKYTFSIEHQFVKSNYKWQVKEGKLSISCYLQLTLQRLRNQIKLLVAIESSDYNKIWMKMVVHLLDTTGCLQVTKTGNITSNCPLEFISDNVKQLLADEDLRVRCELILYSEVTHTPVRTKPNFQHLLPTSSELQPGTRLTALREEACLTDFVLSVDRKELHVHKVVLAAQSPVFRRMIETNMRECKEGRVIIEDIPPEVAEEMVTYMYTGKAPRMLEMTNKLFEVADKYEMDHLKLLCENALCNKLTIANAIDTFLLAEMHSAERLRAVCIELIEDNITRIKEMNGWERLKNSLQFKDLYIQLLESMLPPPTKEAKFAS